MCASLSGGLALPVVAEACGGCFAPPDVPQVVTDHRMVLSISTTRTTLWDQFQFSGSPEDFSWILPVHYSEGMEVAVGSDTFVNALANLSAPSLAYPSLPWPPCPSRPYCGPWGASYDAAAAPQDAFAPPPSDAPPPVTVLREAVAGPYEVRVIRGTDPMEIRNWLRTNGYAVPAAISPVIDFYTEQRMDFIAMRLRPMKGINRIAPIRVSFPGTMFTLPLRMIAAGVADRVGLSLLVLAQGRMEASNFPNDQYTDDDFTFDWSRPNAWNPIEEFNRSFTTRSAAQGGRAWLTESSDDVSRARFAFITMPPPRPDAGADAGLNDANPSDDVRVAFDGLGDSARLTRLRADLLGRMLDRDLNLRASDLPRRGTVYQYGHQTNVPPPPVCENGARYDPQQQRFVGGTPWPACDGGYSTPWETPDGGYLPPTETPDGDIAASPMYPDDSRASCSVAAPASRSSYTWWVAVLALAVTSYVRRRRARR